MALKFAVFWGFKWPDFAVNDSMAELTQTSFLIAGPKSRNAIPCINAHKNY